MRANLEKYGIKYDNDLLAILPSIKVFPDFSIEKDGEIKDSIDELKKFFANLRNYSLHEKTDIQVRYDLLSLIGIIMKLRNDGVRLQRGDEAEIDVLLARYLNKKQNKDGPKMSATAINWGELRDYPRNEVVEMRVEPEEGP